MKEITIKIPTKYDIKRWFEIIKFKINGGFKCTECSQRLFFNSVRIEKFSVHGEKFLFHNYSKKLLCPSCIQKEINQNADKIFNKKETCDWCKEKKLTTAIISKLDYPELNLDIRFGSRWWNGHYICQDCMNEGLDDSVKNMVSGILQCDEKANKYRYVNSLGMMKIK